MPSGQPASKAYAQAWAGRNDAYGNGERSSLRADSYSDRRLLEEVSERISRSGVDVKDISVHVHDAVVTLRGQVRDERMKRATEAVVARCKKVARIDNHLEIKPGASGRSIASYGSDA